MLDVQNAMVRAQAQLNNVAVAVERDKFQTALHCYQDAQRDLRHAMDLLSALPEPPEDLCIKLAYLWVNWCELQPPGWQ